MGRPSLRATRRPELLGAVEAVILRTGVTGMTVAAVAAQAGVPASLVHHYLGSRQEMLDAALERALVDVERVVVHALDGVAAAARLDALLDALFGPALRTPTIEQLVEHLIVASYDDPSLRRRLSEVYDRFGALIDEALADSHPHVEVAARRRTSHALLALSHVAPTFDWLDFEPDSGRLLRQAAADLVAALPPAR